MWHEKVRAGGFKLRAVETLVSIGEGSSTGSYGTMCGPAEATNVSVQRLEGRRENGDVPFHVDRFSSHLVGCMVKLCAS